MQGEAQSDFDGSELTIDQHGMLELLGNPRAREYRLIEFRLEPRRIAGVPGIARPRIAKLLCPLITILGRDRLILPNGDVLEPALLNAAGGEQD
jgi:hypothetical protein